MTILASACAASDEQIPSAPQPDPTYGAACAKLDSQLYQLTQSADPAAFAANTLQEFRDGRVRVIVELSGTADPAPSYDLVEEARYANQIQAMVPVDRLCALANDANVAAVRSATNGGPNGPAGGGGSSNVMPKRP